MTEDQIQLLVTNMKGISGGLNRKINIRRRSEWKEERGRRLRKSWLEQVDEFLKKKKGGEKMKE